jgi:hypothetical protein
LAEGSPAGFIYGHPIFGRIDLCDLLILNGGVRLLIPLPFSGRITWIGMETVAALKSFLRLSQPLKN